MSLTERAGDNAWRHGSSTQGRTGLGLSGRAGFEDGVWWSPDSSKIAFLEMDESKVTRFPLVDFASFAGAVEEERYPIAGGNNPVVHVYVVSVNGGKAALMDTGSETNQYIPRVAWLRDSKRVAIERLNRLQTQLDLLIAGAETGKSSVVLTEKDLYWINVPMICIS